MIPATVYQDPRISISTLLMVSFLAMASAQRSLASAQPGAWTKLLALPVALMAAALVGAIRMSDTLGIVGVVSVAVVYGCLAAYLLNETFRTLRSPFARDVLTALAVGLIWASGQWLFEVVKGFH